MSVHNLKASRPALPYTFGVRLSLADKEKLCALADVLGQRPTETLRYLVRMVASGGAHVQFTEPLMPKADAAP